MQEIDYEKDRIRREEFKQKQIEDKRKLEETLSIRKLERERNVYGGILKFCSEQFVLGEGGIVVKHNMYYHDIVDLYKFSLFENNFSSSGMCRMITNDPVLQIPLSRICDNKEHDRNHMHCGYNFELILSRVKNNYRNIKEIKIIYKSKYDELVIIYKISFIDSTEPQEENTDNTELTNLMDYGNSENCVIGLDPPKKSRMCTIC